MTKTRIDASHTPNVFSWPPVVSVGHYNFATSPLAPFGFNEADTLGRSRQSFGPLGVVGAVPAGDPGLAAQAKGQVQQLHQTGPASVQPIRVMGHTYRPGQGDKLWLNLESRGKSYAAWAKANPALAREVGAPRHVNKMINSLRSTFDSQGSPLAKYAKNFVVAGYLSGYDPRFIGAFAAEESAWGRAVPGNAPYNFWGWSVYTGSQSSGVSDPFRSPGTAFRYYGQQLHDHYGGAKSVYSPIWRPYAADPNHAANIAGILSTYFHGNPNDIRFNRAMGL